MRDKLNRAFSSIVVILIAACAVRAVFLYYYFHSVVQHGTNNAPFGYEAGAVAAAIAKGHGFSSPLSTVQTGPTAWFTPIYPYLLAAIFRIFGVYSYTSHIVICAIDNLFSALTCWPIYSLGRESFGRRVGLSAAWVWVVFPMSIFFATVWVWDTALTTLMLALIVAATVKLRGSPRVGSWTGYGALWAAGSMVNASLVSLVLPLAVWALWPLRRQIGRAARVASAFGFMFIAGIAPWTIRNYVVFHQFIPFRSNFALELWLGNNDLVADMSSPNLHPNNSAPEAAKFARMTEIPYMRQKREEALRFLRTHRSEALALLVRRLSDNWLAMWVSPFDLWSRAPLQVKLGTMGNAVFPLLSLLGILFAYRQRNETATAFASVMLFFPLVFYVTHTSARYSHPMDPILVVLAIYGLAHLAAYLLKRFCPSEPELLRVRATD